MATQFSVKDHKSWKARFFTIWGGQALSILESQLVQFALIWHLTIKTGSATVLGTSSLVGILPNVILALGVLGIAIAMFAKKFPQRKTRVFDV